MALYKCARGLAHLVVQLRSQNLSGINHFSWLVEFDLDSKYKFRISICISQNTTCKKPMRNVCLQPASSSVYTFF